MGAQSRHRLLLARSREHDRPPVGLAEELTDDANSVGDGLAWAVDSLGQPLAQGTMVVDTGKAEVGIGQAADLANNLVGAHAARNRIRQEAAKGGLVHVSPCCHAGDD